MHCFNLATPTSRSFDMKLRNKVKEKGSHFISSPDRSTHKQEIVILTPQGKAAGLFWLPKFIVKGPISLSPLTMSTKERVSSEAMIEMSDGSNNPMQADLSSPMEDLESSVPEQESEEVKKSRLSRVNNVIKKVLMTPIIPGEFQTTPCLLPSSSFN